MAKEEILAMEAGEKLDELIAERIFGARLLGVERVLWKDDLGCVGEKPFATKFSTDISAAWRVVEKICNWDVDDNMLILKGQAADLEPKDEEGKVGWWEAEINGTWGKVIAEGKTAPEATWGKVIAEGKTAPEAICKAALLTRLDELKRFGGKMKIKGQHGEFGWLSRGEPLPIRQIELEEGERLEIYLKRKDGGREPVIDFFSPGLLTLRWESGGRLEGDQ